LNNQKPAPEFSVV